MTNKKWYQSNLAIIGLLVLFFPVGLFLMWKYAKWNKKVKWAVSGFFAFIVLVNMLGGGNETKPSSVSVSPTPIAKATPTPTPEPTKNELDADIRFSDTAVMITNKEDKEWTNCKLEINSSGLFTSGYVYKLNSLQPKDPIIIALRDFTKDDGTRFDSYSTKPQNISLSCEVDGQHAFGYYGN